MTTTSVPCLNCGLAPVAVRNWYRTVRRSGRLPTNRRGPSARGGSSSMTTWRVPGTPKLADGSSDSQGHRKFLPPRPKRPQHVRCAPHFTMAVARSVDQ